MILDTCFLEGLLICTNQSLSASGLNRTLVRTHCASSESHTLQRHPGSSGHRCSTFVGVVLWSHILNLPLYPASVVTSNGFLGGLCCLMLVDKIQQFSLVMGIEEGWYGSHVL